ncbi:leucyl aminopeptidase family protein [Algoriphagus sp. C2-6-M1]|uniref:leucyl aminopeptidase family protein n=1 Tax=Algoriphagus persicinus TaxID=3108754 RepID=UPI002B3C4501|nr:leucyl aminopeptidase family protein [Algoriphagus sp. C2-6-M1]MEB2780604.1 leucyl aminopeptidase family protein [Algoriphagus sp. C2-6-M1]
MQFHIPTEMSENSGLRIIPLLGENSEEILIEKLNGFSVNASLFKGKKDSSYQLDINGKLILLIGLGENTDVCSMEKSFRRVLSKNKELVETTVTIDFPDNFPAELIESALIGFQLGAYNIGFFKQKKEGQQDFENLEVSVISSIIELQPTLDRAAKIASAKIEGFKLVDLPPNVVTPEYLANWAAEKGAKHGFSVRVFGEEKAKSEGLDAFLAVARGSAKAPKFIIMEYRSPDAKFHLGLVGKGVTFDTGGLNIKTQGMVYMKSDMGGAAAVLAATQLIASLKLPINLTAIVPAVENSVDKDAYLPSEVIGSHAGLSIEVIDTDAEGRLILADGLSYLVKNYQVDQLIDLATLTGSSVGTFGYECGALFSNSDAISDALSKAGMQSGEKVWPLPMWESYRSEMDSEIADIKNYHGKPIAGAITAAKFLEAFIHEHPAWAHLDIAGVAFGDSEFSKTKSGTAFGVQLLLKFIENQV